MVVIDISFNAIGLVSPGEIFYQLPLLICNTSTMAFISRANCTIFCEVDSKIKFFVIGADSEVSVMI